MKINMLQKTVQILKNIIQKKLTKVMFSRHISGLGKNSIALDCGANLGDITEMLAKTGASVYAFEPNPFAYKKLTERVKSLGNVTCLNKGVWHKNTFMKLYLHQMAETDDEFWSFGSSIIEQKGNIDKSRSVEAEIIDLTEFIENLGKEIDLLKIDIEGAECELLEKFIEKEQYKKVEITLVEIHDRKIQGQKKKTDRIRNLIKEKNIKNIKLNWL